MTIVIQIIAHQEQRYSTTGDWEWTEDGSLLVVRVSKMNNWKHETLVAVHEMIEAILCRSDGVRGWDVDTFDMAYEKTRPPGDNSEPGDNPRAPYYTQHQIATGIERILAAEMCVGWGEYEAANERLYRDERLRND